MDDDLYYDIDAHFSQSLFSEEGTRWITQIAGSMNYYPEDESDPVLAGQFRFFHVDLVSASEVGMDPLYVLNHLSETEPFMALFDTSMGMVYRSLQIEGGSDSTGLKRNLLICDRIEILPQHRGKGLTDLLINEIVRLFGKDCSLLSVHCFPLQLEGQYLDGLAANGLSDWQQEMQLSSFGHDASKATRQLKAFYSSLGFKVLPKENVMYKVLEHTPH